MSPKSVILILFISVDLFRVSAIGSTTEETSASLTWTSNNYGLSGVTYEISANPVVSGAVITADANGGSLQNLSPGTQYTLTITTVVPANSPYASTKTAVTYSITTSKFICARLYFFSFTCPLSVFHIHRNEVLNFY